MLRILKWIYDLGRTHERRRIELAIREYRQRPGSEQFFLGEEARARKEDLDREVEDAVHRILWPHRTEVREVSILDDPHS